MVVNSDEEGGLTIAQGWQKKKKKTETSSVSIPRCPLLNTCLRVVNVLDVS